MPTLTPQNRSEEATSMAFRDGMIAGACALVPSSAAVWAAMRSPRFVKATNYSSRTALVVMPALFIFAYSSEKKLQRKMHEIAEETKQHKSIAVWAERKRQQDEQMLKKSIQTSPSVPTSTRDDSEILKLYRKSADESVVRVVPGNKLGFHHQFANFWQENPFKILAAMGVPAVGYIFYGRNQQQHLQLQSKIMHTRVFGQFTVIALLLSLMGFKEYMDHNGKFVTEAEANRKAEEMQRMRLGLMARIEEDKAKAEERQKILMLQPGEKKYYHHHHHHDNKTMVSDDPFSKAAKENKTKKQHNHVTASGSILEGGNLVEIK